MSAEKRPNQFLASVRNALVSQVVAWMFATAGGAGVLTAVLAYIEKTPLVYAVPAVMFAVASGAAVVTYVRRVLLDANLTHKFYAFDVGVMHYLDNESLVAGYTPFVQFRNRADVPIEYRIIDCSGEIGGLALPDITRTSGALGRVEAGQDGWHGMGMVPCSPPEATNYSGRLKMRVHFGRKKTLEYAYEKRFSFNFLTNEEGHVLLTRAFHD